MQKEEIRSLICAMVLGDGYVTPIGELRLGHSEKQYDYLVWKTELINDIFKSKGLERRIKPYRVLYKHPTKSYVGYKATLSWKEYLGPQLREKAYQNNKKDFEYLLSQMSTPLHLAIWLMDDGAENRRKRKHIDGSQYYIAPDYQIDLGNCTEGQRNLAVQWLKEKFNLEPRSYQNKRGYYVIWFNSKGSRLIFQIIKPYLEVTESMRKKFWLSFLKY